MVNHTGSCKDAFGIPVKNMPALTLPLGSPFSVGDVVLPGCSIAQPLPDIVSPREGERRRAPVRLHSCTGLVGNSPK